MKTLKNSWLRASVMLLLVTGIFLTLNAMKKAIPVASPDLVSWYYIGDLESNPFDPANYQRTPVAPCGTGEEVICEILAPQNPNGNDEQPLMTEEVIENLKEALQIPLSKNATVQKLRLE